MKNTKYFILFISISLISSISLAQHKQTLENIDSPKEYEYIYIYIYTHKLYSDSLSSSFIIWVKNEVKLHKHIKHTENIYVLDGSGTMQLGEKSITIKPGDYIFIPVNTVHSLQVTSKRPIRVLSIQSPEFLGDDRIFIEK